MVSDKDLFREIYIDVRNADDYERKGQQDIFKSYLNGTLMVTRFGEEFNLAPTLTQLCDLCGYVSCYCTEEKGFDKEEFLTDRSLEVHFRDVERYKLCSKVYGSDTRMYKPLLELVRLLDADLSCKLPKYKEFLDSIGET